MSSDESNPNGRPLIKIDMDKLKALMGLDPKREVAASIMGCSVDTLERRIKEAYDQTYNEFKTQHLAPTGMKLAQKALSEAMSGNSQLLIFCLKHYNGWSDRGDGAGVQVNVQNNVNQNVNIDPLDLAERIKQIKSGQDGDT